MTMYYHGEEVEVLAGRLDDRSGYAVALVEFENGEQKTVEFGDLSHPDGFRGVRDVLEDAPNFASRSDCSHTHVDWDYREADERNGFTHVFGECRGCGRQVRRSMLHLMEVAWET